MWPPALVRVVVLVLVAEGCSFVGRGDETGGALPSAPTTIRAGEGVVVIRNIAYNPNRARTPAGREVVWRFDDSGVTHTVTADEGSFDSGPMASGEFRRTFDQPGEVAYHCEVHARMKGTIVIR